MPPTPCYRLLPQNAQAVGHAMREVAFERTQGAPGLFDCPGIDGVDGQHSLRTWLCCLGGRDTRRACSREFAQTVRWAGKYALRSVVQRQQSEARRLFGAMVRELQRRHLVWPEPGRALEPRIHLDLNDQRGDQRLPLPGGTWLLGRGR